MVNNEEQKKIVEEVMFNSKKNTKRGEWDKYNGDITCGIIKTNLQNHLPNDKIIVGPHVFIDGISNELDLMIIKKEAKSEEFIECYNINDVEKIIEIKKSGIHYGNKKNMKVEETLRSLFEQIAEKKSQIITNKKFICCCLAIQDRIPKNTNKSFNYVKVSREALSPYEYFVLSNHPNYNPHFELENDWKKFVDWCVPS